MAGTSLNSPRKHGGLDFALSAIEALADARRQAEQQILTGMRRRICWLPLMDLSLSLAEVISRERREFEQSLILEVRKKLQHLDTMPNAERNGQGFGEDWLEQEALGMDRTPKKQAVTTPALRLRVPAGPNTIGLPIELQNHRDTPDVITLSVNPPVPNLRAFPCERLHFEPASLTIPAQSSAAVQLILRLDDGFEADKEYWSEILISGTDRKQIALVLQFDSKTGAVEDTAPQDSRSALLPIGLAQVASSQ